MTTFLIVNGHLIPTPTRSRLFRLVGTQFFRIKVSESIISPEPAIGPPALARLPACIVLRSFVRATNPIVMALIVTIIFRRRVGVARSFNADVVTALN
ncbi:hypothetical protein EVAR_44730_1 [Eumeta japonica]|uniref:Uncharacterized protein n=1 Tax=Eumeta variegata TaxID=151549 RepID=A0A4C1XEY5_EUMVA|nr:hypothetical protein EVAR_44730_1 [Eumeta japonica]